MRSRFSLCTRFSCLQVRRQVQEFDVVITSGGVGPTHDDITIFSVARALNQKVRENKVRYGTEYVCWIVRGGGVRAALKWAGWSPEVHCAVRRGLFLGGGTMMTGMTSLSGAVFSLLDSSIDSSKARKLAA